MDEKKGGGFLKWVVVAVVLAAVAGGVVYFIKHRPPTEPTYETVTADKGRIISRVTATGTLSALVTVQVGSQVSGRVQKLYADFNSEVDAGMLIAKIDPELFQASLDQAKANDMVAKGNLAKAQAQAGDAHRQYERSKQLQERQLVAQADLDTAQANDLAAQAQIAVAQGSVEQAKASLKQAQVNLEYTNILSPIKGIVISRSVDVGQTVAASLSAPTIFVIAEDLRKMQVDTSVGEADIGKLAPGMPVSFTVDAFPTDKFSGTVRQIRNAATTVQNVVTYDAVIDVNNPELKLKPGMTANVSFVYAEKDDVIRIPNAALRFRPSTEVVALLAKGRPDAGPEQAAVAPGGGKRREGALEGAEPKVNDRRVVWAMSGARPKPVRVKIGITDGSFTELVEGELEEGAVLITDATIPGVTNTPRAAGAASPFGGSPPGGGGGPRRAF